MINIELVDSNDESLEIRLSMTTDNIQMPVDNYNDEEDRNE